MTWCEAKRAAQDRQKWKAIVDALCPPLGQRGLDDDETTSQKATKTALAVCSMLITFLQEVMYVISGFDTYRLAPKLL